MGSHWKVLRDDNALQELDCFLGINKLSTNSKKMPGTVFKRTEHSEQLDDPPPLLRAWCSPPCWAAWCSSPCWAAWWTSFRWASWWFSLRWAAWWSSIIRGRKIFIGEKVFNFYWCLGEYKSKSNKLNLFKNWFSSVFGVIFVRVFFKWEII